MRVDGAWRRDPDAQRLLATLLDGGHQALFVGGCVRNAALGAPVADIDIATDARPERVIALARDAGFKSVPTGIEHGTVTVVGDRPLEVTTFRRDVETDGRRAVVAFADDLSEDAARRDFTMNALYATAQGTVVDPLGGWDDLVARRVRFVGDARQRIAEDYLRILRYFRFHAWYGDSDAGLDAEALAACADGAEGLERLSAERIGVEMMKLLAAPDPAPAIGAMTQCGILARVMPGADPAGLAPLVHLEGLIAAEPDAVRRLAVLGGPDPSDALRLSRKDAARRTLLHDLIGSEAGLAELAWRHGPVTARDAALLRAASFSAPLPADMAHRIALGAGATLPVSGGDFAADAQGPEVGRRLAEAERRWIESGFTLSRDQLLR